MTPSQKYLLAASLLLMMSALTWWSSVSIRQAEQLAAVSGAPAGVGLAPVETVPDEYFIIFTDALRQSARSSSKEDLAVALAAILNSEQAAVTVKRVYSNLGMALIKIPPETLNVFSDRLTTLGDAGLLTPFNLNLNPTGQDGAHYYRAPNHKMSLLSSPTPVKPNDPYFIGQWGLENWAYLDFRDWADIWATRAWMMEAGTSEPHPIVAVMDTDVFIDHPDLRDNIWKNEREIPNNLRDDDNNGVVDDYNGYNTCSYDGNVWRWWRWGVSKHGTKVSGVISAVTNNRIGVAGTAWGAKLMPVVVLCREYVPWEILESSLLDGIDYILRINNRETTAAKKVRVANMSVGYTTPLPPAAVCQAIASAPEILFVAAAGNWMVNIDEYPMYPASCTNPNLITVTAHYFDPVPLIVGNYGPRSVDLSAPGQNIMTTSFGVFSIPTYEQDSGSSLAAPFVSGTAALLLSGRPNTPVQHLKEMILGTAFDWLWMRGKTVTEGSLNACSALWESGARGDPPVPDNPCIFTYPQELPEETPETE